MTTRRAIDILENVEQILRDVARLESLPPLERSSLSFRADGEVGNIDDVIRLLKEMDQE
jgi:hypothetical protein